MIIALMPSGIENAVNRVIAAIQSMITAIQSMKSILGSTTFPAMPSIDTVGKKIIDANPNRLSVMICNPDTVRTLYIGTAAGSYTIATGYPIPPLQTFSTTTSKSAYYGNYLTGAAQIIGVAEDA